MAGKKGQKKRFWSDEEKRSICAQTGATGVSVAQVARRYSMNANLIHKWLRYPQFAADHGENLTTSEAAAFLPVEIESVASAPALRDVPFTEPRLREPLSAHRVDITLSDGRRILVEGSTALSSVVSLVQGLIA